MGSNNIKLYAILLRVAHQKEAVWQPHHIVMTSHIEKEPQSCLRKGKELTKDNGSDKQWQEWRLTMGKVD